MTANIAFLATALILVPVLSLAQGASRRVLILDQDLSQVEAAVASERGITHKRLKYQQGLVATLPEPALKRISEKIPSARIEEDIEMHLLGFKTSGRPGGGESQPAQVLPWGIKALQAPEAFAYNRGAGAVVCVVDAGIQTTHPDLAGQVIGGENFVVIKGKIDPKAYSDDNGHGTHVAGTIAALDNSIGVVGVAPQAKLLAMKVLNRQGSGYLSDVIDGILACGAQKAHIISMSLGGSASSDLLHKAIQDVTAQGLKVVAAAGNESTQVSYPAAYPEVLAVSAVDSSGQFASFSNFGSEIDYAGPGVSILSTTKDSSYATFSGTSMATPHVSGVLALALSNQSLSIVTVNLGLSAQQQGLGLVNALLTVKNK